MPPGIGYSQPNLAGPPIGSLNRVFGPGPRLPGNDMQRMFTEMAMAALQEVVANNLLYNPAVNPLLNPFPEQIPGNWATDRDAMDRQLMRAAADAGPTQVDTLLGQPNASALLEALGLSDLAALGAIEVPPLPEPAAPAPSPAPEPPAPAIRHYSTQTGYGPPRGRGPMTPRRLREMGFRNQFFEQLFGDPNPGPPPLGAFAMLGLGQGGF